MVLFSFSNSCFPISSPSLLLLFHLLNSLSLLSPFPHPLLTSYLADKVSISLPVNSDAKQTLIMLWHLLEPQLTKALCLPSEEGRKKIFSVCISPPVLFFSLRATLWICDQSVGTRLTFYTFHHRNRRSFTLGCVSQCLCEESDSGSMANLNSKRTCI